VNDKLSFGCKLSFSDVNHSSFGAAGVCPFGYSHQHNFRRNNSVSSQQFKNLEISRRAAEENLIEKKLKSEFLNHKISLFQESLVPACSEQTAIGFRSRRAR